MASSGPGPAHAPGPSGAGPAPNAAGPAPAPGPGVPDSQHLQHALKLVAQGRHGLPGNQRVRADTAKLWQASSEGPSAPHGDDAAKEKRYLADLKSRLDTAQGSIAALEAALSRQQPMHPLPLGPSLYLSLDAAAETLPLYNDLAATYKWMDQAHSVSAVSAQALAANNLRKTVMARDKKGKTRLKPLMANPRMLEDMIANLSRTYVNMQFKVTRPNDTKLNAIVEVSLDRVLKAVIVFKGVMIEWVVVRGFGEETPQAARRAPSEGPDVWTESKYKVFRKITENANAAMLNYHNPTFPELVLKSFPAYLHSFKNIFTDKCNKCHLHLHNNLPPTWREFNTLEPYHEDCRP